MTKYYAVVRKDDENFDFCNLSPLDGGMYSESFKITSSLIHATCISEGLKQFYPRVTYTIISFDLPEEN